MLFITQVVGLALGLAPADARPRAATSSTPSRSSRELVARAAERVAAEKNAAGRGRRQGRRPRREAEGAGAGGRRRRRRRRPTPEVTP